MLRRATFLELLLLALLGASACQKLDSDLASGSPPSTTVLQGTGGMPGTTNPGTGNAGVVGTDCVTVRMEAHDVLSSNCAVCHQAPGTPALYAGTFNFILDLQALTTNLSPASTATTTLKYVVKGSPSTSFIYERIVANSMPPANRTQRPSAGDIQVLDEWITSCIDDVTSPEGWSDPGSTPDGGVDPGPMLDACGTANVCLNGGCCVFARCRPNGTTCGPLPNPIPGQTDLPGFQGMCTNGSCQNMAGESCGRVGQPCCDLQSCTASQASCLTTDLTMCSACGDVGLPCCKPANCLPGRQCVGDGVGRVGECMMCGQLGQPCCGSLSVALQTCSDPSLTCIPDSTQESRCVSSTSTGTGGASGTGGAGGRAGAATGGRTGGAAGGRAGSAAGAGGNQGGAQ